MARSSRLFIFNFKEKFSVLARIAEKFVLKILSKKLYQSGSIWHKLFIQMVKYSFPDEELFIEVSLI